MRKFSRRSWETLGSLGSAQLFTLVVGIALSSLWARNVTKEVYGQYQLIVSFMRIISGFCLNGLTESLSISAAKNCDGNLPKILGYRFGATIIGSLALVILSFYYRTQQPAVAMGLLVVSFLFPFNELQKIWMPWLNGRGKSKLVAGLDSAGALLSIVTLWIAILCGKRELNTLLMSLTGVSVLFSSTVVGWLLWNRRNHLMDWSIIRYGFHATAATLLGGLVLSDRFIINKYLSVEKVAVYSIALLFPSQIKTLYSIFNQMLLPQLAAAPNIRSAWQCLRPKFLFLAGIFLLIGIMGFFLIPILIPLFFSDAYVEAIPYGKWLWLSLSVTVPTTYLGSILRAQKKIKYTYIFEPLGPLIQISLFWTLIGYGLWGIVFSKILWNFTAMVLSTGFFFYYFKKET